MKQWLNCAIANGQFTGEFAVEGTLYDSRTFSLFAPKDCLMFKESPSPGKYVDGSICVEVLDDKDDLVLVALPQPTFENGRTITVKRDQIKAK